MSNDRYERIRQALAMEPTPVSWAQDIDEDAAYAMFCCRSAAEAAFVTACDPDTVRALLDERDTLEAENKRLLDALRQITEWPDGGNRYGQENIKRFAQAAIDAAMRKERAMTDLTPERLAKLRRNDEVASHDGGCLYRLKSDYSLEYWRGALEGAFKECEQIERALGLPPEVHTTIYTRLKQWERLLNLLEEVRDEALLRQALEGLREQCARDAERVTDRRRAVAAFINSEAVKPCEVAAAIREIDVQQYYECAVREIERDEALLRQALKALERGAWDTLDGRNAAAAIRERLGEGEPR